LDKADNEKDLDDCCDRIEQLIERLMKEREEVRKQCKSGPQVFVF
jgi:predicted transcriptional regulator